jgi:RNA polymerase sigma-70 factor (ECF subfamily)
MAGRTYRILDAPVRGGEPCIVHESRFEFILSPAWPPDRRHVLFVERPDVKSAYELWRVPVQGGQPEKLGLAADGLYAPRAHPDGTRIAYSAGSLLQRFEIWAAKPPSGAHCSLDRSETQSDARKYSGTTRPRRDNIVVQAMSSDKDLIQKFRAGDREAFTELYRTHQAAVFRFAFYMTADRNRAAEVTQDVFVWLIHHAAEFDPDRGDLAAFLGGVARKLLLRERRDERRWLPLEMARPGAESPEPEAALDAASLRKAIAALPERYRAAVVLCDLEGRSYDEAAAALGCAVGTVRSRLHRGRDLLARKMRPAKEIARCC